MMIMCCVCRLHIFWSFCSLLNALNFWLFICNIHNVFLLLLPILIFNSFYVWLIKMASFRLNASQHSIHASKLYLTQWHWSSFDANNPSLLLRPAPIITRTNPRPSESSILFRFNSVVNFRERQVSVFISYTYFLSNHYDHHFVSSLSTHLHRYWKTNCPSSAWSLFTNLKQITHQIIVLAPETMIISEQIRRSRLQFGQNQCPFLTIHPRRHRCRCHHPPPYRWR